ncbi:MAG: hypothetical protein R3F17_14805 [Planctomycetota bacterium]
MASIAPCTCTPTHPTAETDDVRNKPVSELKLSIRARTWKAWAA